MSTATHRFRCQPFQNGWNINRGTIIVHNSLIMRNQIGQPSRDKSGHADCGPSSYTSVPVLVKLRVRSWAYQAAWNFWQTRYIVRFSHCHSWSRFARHFTLLRPINQEAPLDAHSICVRVIRPMINPNTGCTNIDLDHIQLYSGFMVHPSSKLMINLNTNKNIGNSSIKCLILRVNANQQKCFM